MIPAVNVGYYAGLNRDGKRRALLVGPFATREAAAAVVDAAHEAAVLLDPFCYFDTPGVFRYATFNSLPAGRLACGRHTIEVC